jgi:pantetheine-phosphate adenylyltransferase
MATETRIGLYPGTFDPITKGHLDIIQRALPLFDKIIIVIALNSDKKPLFTADERRQMIDDAVRDLPGVEVDQWGALIVDYARKVKARAIIRGLRAVSDFEYEFQMALMNRKQYPKVDTVYLMPDEKFTYLSSSIVREVANHGGRIECFVTPLVRRMLDTKLNGKSEN